MAERVSALAGHSDSGRFGVEGRSEMADVGSAEQDAGARQRSAEERVARRWRVAAFRGEQVGVDEIVADARRQR